MPNPEEFARQVLWKLAGIESQNYLIQAQMIAERALKSGKNYDQSVQDLNGAWKAGRDTMQAKLFEASAKKAGLSLEAQKTPPPDEPPLPPTLPRW